MEDLRQWFASFPEVPSEPASRTLSMPYGWMRTSKKDGNYELAARARHGFQCLSRMRVFPE
jgi:hypothetical protein